MKRGNDWCNSDNGNEYTARGTHSGRHIVIRGDGCYAEFTSRDKAKEAAIALASGTKKESDFVWHD